MGFKDRLAWLWARIRKPARIVLSIWGALRFVTDLVGGRYAVILGVGLDLLLALMVWIQGAPLLAFAILVLGVVLINQAIKMYRARSIPPLIAHGKDTYSFPPSVNISVAQQYRAVEGALIFIVESESDLCLPEAGERQQILFAKNVRNTDVHNSVYYCQQAGLHRFELEVVLSKMDATADDLELLIRTSNRDFYRRIEAPRDMNRLSIKMSAFAEMDASDTAHCEFIGRGGACIERGAVWAAYHLGR